MAASLSTVARCRSAVIVRETRAALSPRMRYPRVLDSENRERENETERKQREGAPLQRQRLKKNADVAADEASSPPRASLSRPRLDPTSRADESAHLAVHQAMLASSKLSRPPLQKSIQKNNVTGFAIAVVGRRPGCSKACCFRCRSCCSPPLL